MRSQGRSAADARLSHGSPPHRQRSPVGQGEVAHRLEAEAAGGGFDAAAGEAYAGVPRAALAGDQQVAVRFLQLQAVGGGGVAAREGLEEEG